MGVGDATTSAHPRCLKVRVRVRAMVRVRVRVRG